MAFLVADRVQELTTAGFAGTGAVQLNGVPTNPAGRVSFSSGIGNSNETVFLIDDNAGNWEISIGTLTTGSPNSLSRDTVIESSAGGAKVNFTAGVKDVKSVLSAHLLGTIPSLSYVGSASGTALAQTVSLPVAWKRYEPGAKVAFKPSIDNSGAVTLDVDGLGPKPIKLSDGSDPATGQLKANNLTEAVYDGSNFVLAGGTNGGALIQRVHTPYTTETTMTASWAADDTTPQNTEGTELVTLSITPKGTTNKLLISFRLFGTLSTLGSPALALFKDSDADAIKTVSFTTSGANHHGIWLLTHEMEAGTTAPITFKVRASASGLTLYVNRGTVPIYNNTLTSDFWITEYKQ